MLVTFAIITSMVAFVCSFFRVAGKVDEGYTARGHPALFH